tara:strand:- start:648 stop:2075 length:1428 start_codon:yes stop_codon:yes gene_type:complete
MFKAKKYLIALAIISLLFISGCAECKKSADCESKSCFTAKCIDKKCVNNANENCCGNSICEDGTKGTKNFEENKGTCQEDCGACTGETGKYLKNVFDNKTKECATGLDATDVMAGSVTDAIDLRYLKLTATYTYDQPFNIDSSLFNARIELDSKDDSISKVKITQVKVLETAGRRAETSIFGERDINQILWDTNTKIDEDIILTVPIEGAEEEKSITVEIYYEYTKSNRGEDTIEKNSYKKDLTSSKIMFVDPSVTGSCPSSCDDRNPCTDDICSEQTDYFCANTIKQGVCCGNNICDGNENECVCKEDCGECEKDFGDYMAFICSENECKSKLKDIEVMQPKTLIEQPNLIDFQFEVKTRFDEPFDIRTSKATLDIELISKGETVSNIKCTKYQVLVSDVLLGEEVITNTFGSRGSVANLDIILDFSMKNVEEEKSPVLKGSCEYDKTTNDQTQHIITSFSQELGTIVFVKTEI